MSWIFRFISGVRDLPHARHGHRHEQARHVRLKLGRRSRSARRNRRYKYDDVTRCRL